MLTTHLEIFQGDTPLWREEKEEKEEEEEEEEEDKEEEEEKEVSQQRQQRSNESSNTLKLTASLTTKWGKPTEWTHLTLHFFADKNTSCLTNFASGRGSGVRLLVLP